MSEQLDAVLHNRRRNIVKLTNVTATTAHCSTRPIAATITRHFFLLLLLMMMMMVVVVVVVTPYSDCLLYTSDAADE